MRRMLPAFVLALAVLSFLMVTDVGASEGYDGDTFGNGYFQAIVAEDSNPNHPPAPAPLPLDEYWRKNFYYADGWDDRTRISYGCMAFQNFELPDTTDQDFRVDLALVPDYPHAVSIVDKYMTQDGSPCGSNLGPNGQGNGEIDFDGSDHFPHMIHAGDGIQFYKNGVPRTFIDLSMPECSKSYWTPGDEAGEAWLWWDEDGPTFALDENGGEPLNCGGGEGMPIPVASIRVTQYDPEIAFCTVSMHGSLCLGQTTTTPPPPANAPQIRPDGDVETNTFQVVPLFDKLDDNDAADFVSSNNTAGSVSFTETLEDTAAPSVDTGHVLRAALRRNGTNAQTATVTLRQGATTIKSCTFTPTATFAAYECALTEAEAAAITDYNALTVQVTKNAGGKNVLEVGWAELDLP